MDNGTNKYLDALVEVIFELATGTPASDKAVYIYAYGSEDGTDFTDNATGTDAALTLRSPTNLRLIGVINTPDAGGLAYKWVGTVAQAFGGILPRKWGLVVDNKTGVAAETTGCSASYTGITTA